MDPAPSSNRWVRVWLRRSAWQRSGNLRYLLNQGYLIMEFPSCQNRLSPLRSSCSLTTCIFTPFRGTALGSASTR
jgi:hypothetical protein